MSNYVILLPPSQGKSPGGVGKWDPNSGKFADLAPLRNKVLSTLALQQPTLLGLSGTRLNSAIAANRNLSNSPYLPACDRYTGVLYAHLDPSSLSVKAREFAKESLITVSALGGLFGFQDPVPDYRLSMNSRLEDLGLMHRWWEPALSDQLAKNYGTDAVVIDLLSTEYRAAFTNSRALEWYHVELRAIDGRPASHDGKAAKGRLVRKILEENDPLSTLSSWEDPSGLTATLSLL